MLEVTRQQLSLAVIGSAIFGLISGVYFGIPFGHRMNPTATKKRAPISRASTNTRRKSKTRSRSRSKNSKPKARAC